MLFLNRRGYIGFINCRECGYVVKCPHCDVSLTAHNNGRLVCHYCGYSEPDKKICPSCGSKYIGGFKIGTEKIEQAVKELFPMYKLTVDGLNQAVKELCPQARVLRMDLDTTKGKDGHEKILEEFADGNADILVGTQMIVKGHDFPKVSLVGILLADLSLYSSDYRSSERTFELLTQAAGRAGRGEIPGEVVIQTYDPENYSIVKATSHDYEGFYEQEIMFRDLMSYPPVCSLLSVKVASKYERNAHEAATMLLEVAKSMAESEKELGNPDGDSMRIIGPTKAAIYKINDIYSVLLYIKDKNYTFLTQIKDRMEEYIRDNENELRYVSIQFDFN